MARPGPERRRRKALKTDRPRTVLTASEQRRLSAELAGMRASSEVVIEHLTVAAARSGTTVSEWTWARLDALLAAVAELDQQVQHTPLSDD
jgi:hypothetical protein